MTKPTKILVPVAPLTAYIERKYGKVRHVPGLGLPVWKEDRQGKEVLTYERDATEQLRFDNLRKRLLRAKRTGTLTLDAADDTACSYLGVHPCAIWGNDWFEYEVERPLATVTVLNVGGQTVAQAVAA